MNISSVNVPNVGISLLGDLLAPISPGKRPEEPSDFPDLLSELSSLGASRFPTAFGAFVRVESLYEALGEILAELAKDAIFAVSHLGKPAFAPDSSTPTGMFRLGDLGMSEWNRLQYFSPTPTVNFAAPAETAGTLLQLSRAGDSAGSRVSASEPLLPISEAFALPQLRVSSSRLQSRETSRFAHDARREPYERASSRGAERPPTERKKRAARRESLLSKLLRAARGFLDRAPIRSK